MARKPLDDIRTMNSLFPRAEAIAHEMGESEPAAEHLLLAALELPDGSARRAFERVGADPDRFRTALEEHHDASLRAVGVEAPDLGSKVPPVRPRRLFRSTATAQKSFRSIVKRIRTEKSSLHGAWFVLLAAETTQGTVSGVLQRMGVDSGQLEVAARSEIERSDSPGGAW